jgi:hypothetical protein
MNCETFQFTMLEQMGQDLSGNLMVHVEQCRICQQEWADINVGHKALDIAEKIQPPISLVEKTRLPIYRELRYPFLMGLVQHRATLSIALGILATLAALFISRGNLRFTDINAVEFSVASLAWVISFSVAFYLSMGRFLGSVTNNSSLLQAGLLASIFFLILDAALPLTKIVDICHLTGWSETLVNFLGPQVIFFGIGTLYALVPIFLFSIANAKKYHGTVLRGSLITGGIFFFLIAPSIFLQCKSFTYGALSAWLVGALIGSSIGSMAGIKFYRFAAVRL